MPGGPLPRFDTPLVPRNSISGRALVAVVAIMTFLASLTTGAVILVSGAASEWQADVAREVTIQVMPAPGRDLDASVDKAATVARGFPGIGEVRAYSKEESTKLLEPWLGSGLSLDTLAGAAADRGQDRAAVPRPIFRNCAACWPNRCRAPRSTIIAAGSTACAPWREPRSPPASAFCS